MSAEPVMTFAAQHREPHDYVYLLVDSLAECDPASPLSIPSMIGELGEASVERVLRPDLAHTPTACPALVKLAAPGAMASSQLLELSAHYAKEDLAYNKRYVCGWLLSPEPLGVVAQHLAEQCHLTSSEIGKAMTPWFEPIRLELLAAAMGRQVGGVLTPINAWLFPTSWGNFSILRGTSGPANTEHADLVRHTQHAAQLVSDFMGVWRLAQRRRLAFAPWRWNGGSLLPPQAGIHAFRLVRDAQQHGLKNSRDIIALCLHRVFIHPHLPKHPEIQNDIVDAANGIQPLQDRFETYNDEAWKRIVASLPRAENYS